MSHSEKTYKRLESSFLPISLSHLVDNFCGSDVRNTMGFRNAKTEAERCAAFIDFYALEVRLDVVDVFTSKKYSALTEHQASDGTLIDNEEEKATRTVANIVETTPQEEFDARAKAAARKRVNKYESVSGSTESANTPPLMKRISEHTYDLMRYGMFLPSQLILVPDETSLPTDFSDVMADHTFVVVHLQDTEDGSVVVVPIFKFVLRTEAASVKGKQPTAVRSPHFVLRTVQISGKENMNRFFELATADNNRLRLEQNSGAAAAGYEHKPTEATVEAATMFNTLKLLWEESVLTAFPMRAPYFLPDTCTDEVIVEQEAAMPNCHPGKRMRNRLSIQEYSRDLRTSWTEGEEAAKLELVRDRRATKRGSVANVTAIPVHPSCRVLLRDTRSGRNYIEESDLSAFLPTDGECSSLGRFHTLGEERIRVWLLKACLTAEVSDVHQLLFDLDTSLLISQSVELLSIDQDKLAERVFRGWQDSKVNTMLSGGGSSTMLRSKEEDEEEEAALRTTPLANLYALRIGIETIEDFLRHSGIVWRCCVALRDIPASLGRRILKAIQHCTQEEELRQIAEDYAGIKNPQGNAEMDEQRLVLGPQDGTGQLAPYHPPQPGQNVIVSASCSKTPITEDKLYELFCFLDKNGNGSLSVRELVTLFKRKNSKDLLYSKQGTCVKVHERKIMQRVADEDLISRAELLAPLDGCGLPESEADIRKFVLQFIKGADPKALSAKTKNSTAVKPSASPKPQLAATSAVVSSVSPIPAVQELHLLDAEFTDDLKMSYDEFSVMMLTLARR